MSDAPPPPKRALRAWLRPDIILAVAAIFISAMSLLVAIRTEQSQRATLAASMWPYLQRNISGGSGGDPDITVGLSNDGVGPAKVRSVEIFYEGKPTSSVRELLRKCCGYRDDVPQAKQLPEGYVISVADNTVQRAGEQNLIVRLRPSKVAPDIPNRFKAALTKLSFRACYCSALDECWTSDLTSTVTTPTPQCPAPEFPFDPLGK